MIYCCCGCVSPTVTVTGCGGAGVPGCTVSFVESGVTYGPWTTDGSGHAAVTIPAAGSVTWTITPPAGSGYATLTASGTVNCSLLFYTFALSLSSGYTCSGPSCCSGTTSAPGPPYLISSIQWPTTVFLNDGLGTVTMTGGGSAPTWNGCAMRLAANVLVIDEVTCGAPTPATNVMVPVYFTITCGHLLVTLENARQSAACGSACSPSSSCSGGGSPAIQDIYVGGSAACGGSPSCPIAGPVVSFAPLSASSCPPGTATGSASIGPYRGGLACNAAGGSVQSGLENAPFQIYGAGPVGVSFTS